VIFRHFYFKVGEHDLSLASDTQLDEVATALINTKKTQNILIHGHSDSNFT
jgi:outer membrane protein OmpA-like peptidoglycan-associated protein